MRRRGSIYHANTRTGLVWVEKIFSDFIICVHIAFIRDKMKVRR